jgi:alkylation response protein AidB-like acyl-CoA dehydrogenase
MADYRAPVEAQMLALETAGNLDGLIGLPAFETLSTDLARAILEESAKLAENSFAPLNAIGDREGARWQDGAVTLPDGFAAAYRDYVAGGWSSLGADPAYGGQGLPFLLSVAVQEQLSAANLAFSLNPMLTLGAIEALQAHGSDEQKALYLPRLLTGEWTGTMNLTEPQAGSDVGALRTTATPMADGSYRISGQKIFITWGEHDLAENIVHLVLARLPDAPPGTRGISLFLVPKFIPDADGKPGRRNDLRCVSIEHKLGIHASPTCAMSYGDAGECAGWIVGAPNEGMRAMFTMMNNARINVGLQGVAMAERATQDARAYAGERVQAGPIIAHPDVRRMLMTMMALTDAIRALTYANAAAVDRAHAMPDEVARAFWLARASLLTPMTKAYATDIGVEVASLGIQVHGGMGYIEETGAARHYRDARIAPIYEGTNGIQALDLANRKLRGDGGAAMQALEREMEAFLAVEADASLAEPLRGGVAALAAARGHMLAHDPVSANAVATPFLRLAASVVSGWLLASQAGEAAARLASGAGDPALLKARIQLARFYLSDILPQSLALSGVIAGGAGGLMSEDVLPLG